MARQDVLKFILQQKPKAIIGKRIFVTLPSFQESGIVADIKKNFENGRDFYVTLKIGLPTLRRVLVSYPMGSCNFGDETIATSYLYRIENSKGYIYINEKVEVEI
jgi:hypothetical protein